MTKKDKDELLLAGARLFGFCVGLVVIIVALGVPVLVAIKFLTWVADWLGIVL